MEKTTPEAEIPRGSGDIPLPSAPVPAVSPTPVPKPEPAAVPVVPKAPELPKTGGLFEPGKGKKPKAVSVPAIGKAVGGIDLSVIEAKKRLRERTGLYAIMLTVNTIAVIGLGSYSLTHPLVKVVEREKVVEKVVEKEKIIKQNEEIYRMNDNTNFTVMLNGNRNTMTLGEFRQKMSAVPEEQKDQKLYLINIEGRAIRSKLNEVTIEQLIAGEVRIPAE